mmetsp:Transcript_3493/g.7968  ORF Transcript_3493/g.7968 Transcript_3493/m.7968 type:complete len:218 (+) Transcript_3493:124-777(+)
MPPRFLAGLWSARVSTPSRSADMTSAGRSDLNTAEPATMQLAPARAATSTVARFSPPSTWMSMVGNLRRSASTFGIWSAMNAWPPKPGGTVMTSTRSGRNAPSRHNASRASTGVSGRSATPTTMGRDAARTASTTSHGSVAASTWNVKPSAPASAMGPTYASGSETIRWTSKNASLRCRSFLITGGPHDKFGTKWPSMTSMCSASAPASMTCVEISQ